MPAFLFESSTCLSGANQLSGTTVSLFATATYSPFEMTIPLFHACESDTIVSKRKYLSADRRKKRIAFLSVEALSTKINSYLPRVYCRMLETKRRLTSRLFITTATIESIRSNHTKKSPARRFPDDLRRDVGCSYIGTNISMHQTFAGADIVSACAKSGNANLLDAPRRDTYRGITSTWGSSKTSRRLSKSSSTTPVPRTTAVSGSSVICTGINVSRDSN